MTRFRRTPVLTFAAPFVLLFVVAICATSLATTDRGSDANDSRSADPERHPVVRAARAFPDGGAYNEKWAGSGSPEEIRHAGERVLAKGDGTYCCGFTFAVAMRVASEQGLLKGKSIDEVKRFQKEWYGAVQEPDVRERQCAVAVERIGIGKTVEPDDARPGDFCQLWRGKSGHSVVFLGWVEEGGGKRVGLRYRSSQGSTKGVGDATEYFTDAKSPDGKPGRVLRDRIYFGRLNVP